MWGRCGRCFCLGIFGCYCCFGLPQFWWLFHVCSPMRIVYVWNFKGFCCFLLGRWPGSRRGYIKKRRIKKKMTVNLFPHNWVTNRLQEMSSADFEFPATQCEHHRSWTSSNGYLQPHSKSRLLSVPCRLGKMYASQSQK